MGTYVKESLYKALYFMCLMSDTVIDSPFASDGVKQRAYSLLLPIIRRTSKQAVQIITEVVKKRTTSPDVNHFFIVVYNVLGDDIYRKIFHKVSEGISHEDGVFMIQNYRAVAKLRMIDFKTIFEKIARKGAPETQSEASTSASSRLNQNKDTATRSKKASTRPSSSPNQDADTATQSWDKFLLFVDIVSICLIPFTGGFSVFILALHLMKFIKGRENGPNMWEERLCDLDLDKYRSKHDETLMTPTSDTEEPTFVEEYEETEQTDRGWYRRLCERYTSLSSDILSKANEESLFDSTPDFALSELLTSEQFYRGNNPDCERSPEIPGTSDSRTMTRLTNPHMKPLGSLVANVDDLFSTNDLVPATESEPPQVEDDESTLNDPEEPEETSDMFENINFPSMYDSDWRKRMGPPSERNETPDLRMFPINLPDDADISSDSSSDSS